MQSRELIDLLTLANEFKEGDMIVGGTRDDQIRRDARRALASVKLGDISATQIINDGVSESLARSVSPQLASQIANLTVDNLKRILLAADGSRWAAQFSEGLTSEAIAALVKIMSDDELSLLARSLFNPLAGEGVHIGSPAHFGSRIQPNSPGDDEEEILFSILEGLSYGCGDVILGINPASDDVDTIIRLEELLARVVERLNLPTRYSVLSDIVKQTTAKERSRVDVGFQSLAGTSQSLVGMVGLDVDGLLDLAHGFDGLYFETGQGSEVTNGAAEGVDMVTLEARTYGVARHIRKQSGKWMILNDVAGFIGPEVFRSENQLLRACLEDTVMAKLHGITMGLDVCATFHMGIKPSSLQRLTRKIVERAAPAYLMSVAGNADPMLGYMTTSFREHPRLRELSNKHVSTPMRRRLIELGVMNERGEVISEASVTESLYATYMKSGGDTRSFDSIREAGRRKVIEIKERGFDLGYGHGKDFDAPAEVQSRLDSIYRNARYALYASLDDGVIKRISPECMRVRTAATDRENYLSHPAAGEAIRDEDAARLRSLYSTRRPQAQIVISDGLNANAVNENICSLLPALRRELSGSNIHIGATDIVIQNGRVRAGYHAGELLQVEAIIHLIGERPGTGLDTLSAYLTYGRDASGTSRWSSSLNHSATTAICGIHHKGKRPEVAAAEIAHCLGRMFEQRRSGVTLV
jgi:ethanolamine ammonia-lyase large subunit